MNDICLRHPDAKPQRSHLGRYCPECLRESFANHADIEAAQRVIELAKSIPKAEWGTE